MKETSFKTIFIILILIIILGVIYMRITKKEDTQEVGKFETLDNKKTITSNNLRIGIIEFDNINPILSNNKNVQDISRLIFEPLFTLTQDYKIEPKLAKEISKIDDVTYILKLNEKIKWHDGNKFDVSDVIFTIDMLKNQENASIYSSNVKDILELEIIDEYTLKIIVNQKIPYFEYNLIFPIMSSKYFTEVNFTSESKNIKIPGTGMFYISDLNSNSILLKKSTSNIKNKTIKLDTINLNLYNSLASTINAFKSGDIDIFTTANKNIDEYLKNISYNKKEYINRKYDYIILNCADNILSNKEVRQAINSAINKDIILKEVYNERYRKSNFPLDFGSFVYDIYNGTIAYDENIAKGLLIDNGWKYSSNKWRKTVNYRNLSIELDLLVNKQDSDLVKVAKKIKEQLEVVGIKINLKEVKYNEFNKCLENGKYNLVLVSNNYGYSPSLKKYFGTENSANYQNEEIINIISDIDNISDENELKQKYTRITEIYNDEVPYISLYYDINSIIYSPYIKGTISPNSYNLFYGLETWYREYKK